MALQVVGKEDPGGWGHPLDPNRMMTEKPWPYFPLLGVTRFGAREKG